MSHAKLNPIPAGTIFYASRGEYSDYSVIAILRAKVELVPELLRDKFLEENPGSRWERKPFVSWLYEKDLVELLEHWEWNVDDYNDFEGFDVSLREHEE
jgi:hypothetical protein